MISHDLRTFLGDHLPPCAPGWQVVAKKDRISRKITIFVPN